MSCLYASACGAVLKNFKIIIKLRRLKSTRAGACIIQIYKSWSLHYSNLQELEPALLKSTRPGACIIQILQELELEPALLKINRTGRVRIIHSVTKLRPQFSENQTSKRLLTRKYNLEITDWSLASNDNNSSRILPAITWRKILWIWQCISAV